MSPKTTASIAAPPAIPPGTLLLYTKIAQAQENADYFGKLTTALEVAATPTPAAKTPWWTADSAMTISACVLVFGLCVMLMSARALLRGIPAAAVLRLFGMLTIIVMSVFLIVAGYNTEQVAPVVGLLGTLAGYLVGRSASSEIADKVKATLAPATTVPPLAMH
jgi:hypothetical protein